MKSTTLFLALGSIVAAASNNADVVSSINNEDWDYEVVGESRAADADEDRSLLRSATECITIRMSGDGDHDKNSVTLEDMTAKKILWQKDAGELPQGILDSECIAPPAGNLLKFTVNSPQGYSNGFHAVFVGSLRFIRVAGNVKKEVDTECFMLTENEPYVKTEDCDAAPQSAAVAAAVAEVSTSGSNAGAPPKLESTVIPLSSRMGCGSGERKIKVVFEKDNYNENLWHIQKKNSNNKVLECERGNGNYCNSQTVEQCLEADDYEVVMKDAIGDGCPKFELYMEDTNGRWQTLIKKCFGGTQWSRHFHTKSISMTSRDQEWLDAHNKRRAKYWWNGSQMKSNGNPSYIPQKWDSHLASMAKTYAETLLDGCETDKMAHDPSRQNAGENMAKNRGSPGSEYGSQYAPDNIVNRFVEAELDNDFGDRYHLTQVLWKASEYVGCADAFKEYRVGGVLKHCHTQVCRYSAPGNCSVNADNDFDRMMLDFDSMNCGGAMRYPPNVPDISNSVTMKSLFVLLLTLLSKCIGFSFRNSNTCTHGRVLPLMMHPQSSTTQEDEAIEELMKKHDPILLFASKLLDDETARDASALYAWCRRLDEITDDPSSDVATIQQRLSDWESRFDMICRNEPVDDMDRALAMYLQRNDDLELSPFIDMISGMQADSVLNRTISNMAELEEYAYQVAGTVGLMLLPLLNSNVEQSRDAAIALGKAIQLINILRDASPDVALGRVYLPQDMLRAEGVSTEDVLQRKSSPEYRKVVAAVADRAEALLLEAEIGKSTLPGIGPLFVQIIVELYREYLVKLGQIGYDNLNLRGERVKINSIQKLMASVKAAIKVFLTQR